MAKDILAMDVVPPKNFAQDMMFDIAIANEGTPPWEVVALYVAALEKRVAELERKSIDN